jgi:hypothetical protein
MMILFELKFSRLPKKGIEVGELIYQQHTKLTQVTWRPYFEINQRSSTLRNGRQRLHILKQMILR